MSEKTQENSCPPRIESVRGWPWPLVIVLASLAVGLALVLFTFDPAQHAFYPMCLFKQMTGYDCPGCGGLRALHHLLHGDVRGAFHLNALAVIALPLLAVGVVRAWWKSSHYKEATKCTTSFWVWLVVGAVILFGIVRNLPWWPFGVTPM